MKMLTRFSWKTSFEVFQLSWFFFLASLALSWGGNVVAQGTTMGDCSGKFTFEAWKSYDPLTNKTSFTYKVVNVGRVNAISHLSMPLACNPPTPGINIAQILVGSMALISSDGVNWSPVSSSYGEDPSENCSVGAVFKFDGSVPGDTDWYRLVVLGNWQLTPATAIIKYGPYCCTISVPNGRCLEEACPSIPVAVQSDTICVGSIGELRAVASGGTSPYTYSWSGPDGFNASGSSIYTSLAGSYMVIARDIRGCSGMGMGLLAVNPTTSSTNRLTICSNQLPYNWDGLVFNAAGEQTKAGLVNQYGCDSTALYVLSVNPTTSSTNRLTICSNQLPYNWGGLVFNAAGEQTKSGLVNQYGCDSTALYVLSVNPTTSSTNRLTICSNQLPYNWDGLVFTAAGEQTKAGLLNQYGCDSMALYVLSVNPTTSSTNRLTICSNQLPYNWDGLVFTAAGEQTKAGLVNQYGCDSTALFVLTTVNPPVINSLDRQVCIGKTLQLMATPAGGTWSGSYVTSQGVFDATNLVAGLYMVSYTISGVCTVTKQVQIRVESCLTHCTYTQGYYGNVGGIACTPNGPRTTTQLITGSLAAMPNGILYLGVAGRSFTARNAAELIRILPGGGPASLLPGGNHTASSSAILKGGRINNVLLAQTITLGLNVYMPGSSLGSLSLAGGVGGADKYLVTVEKQSGDCATLSTAIPKACTFVPTYCLDGVTIRSYTLVSNPYKSWRISAKVLQALPGNKTVMDLWQLASQALGGTLPAGLSYSEIANAVAAINEAFDGCRIWVGFSSSSSVSGYCNYPPVTVCPELPAARFGVPKANQGSANLSSTLQVEAFPNPSRGQLTFRWISPESGKALLELFDVQGKRLAVLFDGLVTADVPYVIGYTSSASVSSVLIYKMKVGRSVVTGKIQVLK